MAAFGRRSLIFWILGMVHLWPVLLAVHGLCTAYVWPIYGLCMTYIWPIFFISGYQLISKWDISVNVYEKYYNLCIFKKLPLQKYMFGKTPPYENRCLEKVALTKIDVWKKFPLRK